MTKTKATHATDPNAQAPQAQADGQTAQQAHTGAASPSAGAGPAVAATQAPTTPDENQGRGGRYVRQKDGTRVLEERTLSEAEAAAETAKAGQAQAD